MNSHQKEWELAVPVIRGLGLAMGLLILNSACETHTPFANRQARAEYLAAQNPTQPPPLVADTRGQNQTADQRAEDPKKADEEKAKNSPPAPAKTEGDKKKEDDTRQVTHITGDTKTQAAPGEKRLETDITKLALGEHVLTLFPFSKEKPNAYLVRLEGPTYKFVGGPLAGQKKRLDKKSLNDHHGPLMLRGTKAGEPDIRMVRSTDISGVCNQMGVCGIGPNDPLRDLSVPSNWRAEDCVLVHKPENEVQENARKWEDLAALGSRWRAILLKSDFSDYSTQELVELQFVEDEKGTLHLRSNQAGLIPWAVPLSDDNPSTIVTMNNPENGNKIRLYRPKAKEFPVLTGMIEQGSKPDTTWFISVPIADSLQVASGK